MLGSLSLYYIVEPKDSDEEIERIVKKFEKSYVRFVRDIRKLTNILRLHEEEISEIVSLEDRFSIKHIVQSFERKTPDWDAIMKDKKIMKLYTKQFGNKQFHSLLNERIKEFQTKYKIKVKAKSWASILSNPEFQLDIMDLIESYMADDD